jgi:hypothetical protein
LLHILCVILGASVVFCFFFCNKWLVWERDTLHFFMWILIFFTYICWVFLSSYCNAFSSCFSWISCLELVNFLQLYMIGSLVFIDYYLWELFQINSLVLEKSKIFHAYSGAKGSLFRPWLRLYHVMLDIILIICLVVIVVAWLRVLNVPLK